MNVRHQPPEEMLLDYAAGTLAQPLALLVSAHLSLAPESRREVREFERIGGALLEDLQPAPVSEDALARVLARLDDMDVEPRRPEPETIRAETASAGAAPVLPAAVRACLGGDVDEIRWKQRTSKVAECDILPDYPGFRTRLLRIKAGSKIPHHTHSGCEYTLVLQGSFHDECGNFSRGDFAVADSDVTHQPVAGRECDCICLTVIDAPLRMTGPIGRVLNYFIDM